MPQVIPACSVMLRATTAGIMTVTYQGNRAGARRSGPDPSEH